MLPWQPGLTLPIAPREGLCLNIHAHTGSRWRGKWPVRLVLILSHTFTLPLRRPPVSLRGSAAACPCAPGFSHKLCVKLNSSPGLSSWQLCHSYLSVFTCDLIPLNWKNSAQPSAATQTQRVLHTHFFCEGFGSAFDHYNTNRMLWMCFPVCSRTSRIAALARKISHTWLFVCVHIWSAVPVSRGTSGVASSRF